MASMLHVAYLPKTYTPPKNKCFMAYTAIKEDHCYITC